MVKKCPICGTVFEGSSRRVYCSSECGYEASKRRARKAHSHKLPLKKCERCGKLFQPFNHYQTVCGWDCQSDGKKLQDRACKWCGTLFAPKDKKQKYCSADCEKMEAKSKTEPPRYDPDAVRKRRLEMAKIEAKARRMGVSYGEYAMKYM